MEAIKTTGIVIVLLILMVIITIASATISALIIIGIPVFLWWAIYIIRTQNE